MVSDFFAHGRWDVEKLRGVLPEEWFRKLLVAQLILEVFWRTARFGNLLIMRFFFC